LEWGCVPSPTLERPGETKRPSTGDVLREDGVRDKHDVVAVVDELSAGRCDAVARWSDTADELPRHDVDDDELADDSHFTVNKFRVSTANYQR